MLQRGTIIVRSIRHVEFHTWNRKLELMRARPPFSKKSCRANRFSSFQKICGDAEQSGRLRVRPSSGFEGSPKYPLSGSKIGRPASVCVTVARNWGDINSGDSMMGNELGGPLISNDDLHFGIALTATAAAV